MPPQVQVLPLHHDQPFLTMRAPIFCLATAPQGVCHHLAQREMGSLVEACSSAVPFFVEWLRDWADTGALVLHPPALCALKEKMVVPASAT